MAKAQLVTQGGVDISGTVNVTGDLVAGDAYHLVLFGRFLDLVQAQEILPPLSADTELAALGGDFRPLFDSNKPPELVEATRIAGSVLADLFRKYTPVHRAHAFDYTDVLNGLAVYLGAKFRHLGYWRELSAPLRVDPAPEPRKHIENCRVIWFTAQSRLWADHLAQEHLFGLARLQVRERKDNKRTDEFRLVCKTQDAFQDEPDHGTAIANVLTDWPRIGRAQFRIFMLGVAVDMVRLVSMVRDDVDFWVSLRRHMDGGPHGRKKLN